MLRELKEELYENDDREVVVHRTGRRGRDWYCCRDYIALHHSPAGAAAAAPDANKLRHALVFANRVLNNPRYPENGKNQNRGANEFQMRFFAKMSFLTVCGSPAAISS